MRTDNELLRAARLAEDHPRLPMDERNAERVAKYRRKRAALPMASRRR